MKILFGIDEEYYSVDVKEREVKQMTIKDRVSFVKIDKILTKPSKTKVGTALLKIDMGYINDVRYIIGTIKKTA